MTLISSCVCSHTHSNFSDAQRELAYDTTRPDTVVVPIEERFPRAEGNDTSTEKDPAVY